MRKHPPFCLYPDMASAGFCSGLILHSRLVCDPVHFPRLTTIFGERLFEVGGVLGHLRPDVANEDHSAVEGVLGEEFTASVLELAELGGPPRFPVCCWPSTGSTGGFPGYRVEESDLQYVQPSHRFRIPRFSALPSQSLRVTEVPPIRPTHLSRYRLQSALEMNLPAAEFEVESRAGRRVWQTDFVVRRKVG